MSDILGKFFRGAIITAVTGILIGLGNYVARRELAMRLSISDFGLLYSAIGVFQIVCALADCGLNNTLTLRLSQYTAENDHRSSKILLEKVFLIKCVLMIVLTAILEIFADVICQHYFQYKSGGTLFRIAVLYCLSYPFLLFSTATFCGIKSFVKMNILQTIFYFPPALILLFLPDCTATCSVSCYILGGFLVFPLSLFFLMNQNKIFKNVDQSISPRLCLGKDIFSAGKWFFLGNIIFSILATLDILLISYRSGVATAGMYNIAIAVSMIAAPLVFITNLSLPLIGSAWKKHDFDEIRKFITVTINVWSVIFWSGTVFFMLFSKDLITILFSANFLEATIPCCILGSASIINTLLLFFYGVLNGMENQKKANLILIVGLPINIVVNCVLSFWWPLAGPAWGTFLGCCIVCILLYCVLVKKMNNLFFKKSIHLYGIVTFMSAFFVIDQSFQIRLIFWLILFLICIGIFFNAIPLHRNLSKT